MTQYSVYVEIGSYVWGIDGDDTDNNLAPAYGLADPLVINKGWPESDFRPTVQPDPDTATISIIAPNSSTYRFNLSDPVAIHFHSVYSLAGTPALKFYGRVVGMTANPHDLGVIYSLSCADYTVDLQEENTVGLVAYPAERVTDRLNRIMDEALIPRLPAFPPLVASDYPSVGPRAVSPATPYQLLTETLGQWSVLPTTDELGVAVGTPGLRHNIAQLVPQILPGTRRLDGGAPFALEWVKAGRRTSWTPPLRLASVGGLLTATAATANTSPATFSWILDAGRFNIGSTFTQKKGGSALAKVAVNALTGSSTYDWSRFFWDGFPTRVPVMSALVDTQLNNTPTANDAFGGQLLQSLRSPYQPETETQWSVGTLEWEAWAEASGWTMPSLGDLVTLARVTATKTPANREWIAGVVSGFTFTLAAGRPVIDLELDIPNNSFSDNAFQLGHTNGVCCFDSPQIGGWVFSSLSTRDTFIDYRLVRGTA